MIWTYLATRIQIKNIRRTKGNFDDIKQRLGQKLAGWKSMTLSTASKLVLISSNLTGIPKYSKSWFKISKYVCKDIDSSSRIFLEKNKL